MYKSVKPYPPELQNMLTFKGFLAAYYKKLSDTKTDKEAYEATELIYIQYFGSRKYSCYQTFIVVRARNIKK